MPAVLDRVSDVQDKVISALADAQEPVSGAVAVAVAYVVDAVPTVPALPFADQIPTPKQVIDNQAKFASKLVTTNKSLALAVAAAAQPLTDQLLDRKPAPVRAAKKAA